MVMEYGSLIILMKIQINMKDNIRMTVKAALESIGGRTELYTKANF
jgi:hypothetical protein